jgi:hypothetical protein
MMPYASVRPSPGLLLDSLLPFSLAWLSIHRINPSPLPFLYRGFHKYVPNGLNRGAADGFGERPATVDSSRRARAGKPTAISCSTPRKATEGIVGRSEANPLPPDARTRLAQHLFRNRTLLSEPLQIPLLRSTMVCQEKALCFLFP